MCSVKTENELPIDTSDNEGEEDCKNSKSSRFRSYLWDFFTLSEDGCWVRCNKCKHSMRKACNSNMRKHLARKHPTLKEKLEEIERKDPGRLRPKREKIEPPIKKVPKLEDGYLEHVNMTLRRSNVWRNFTILNSNKAKCNFCAKRFSMTSISNLRKHLTRLHAADMDYTPIDKGFKNNLTAMVSEENDETIDGKNFPDDAEGVKALLGLTGAQVNKTIEIIEQVDEDEENFHEEYLEDSDEELIVKKTAKPVLKKCLESVKKSAVQPVESVVKKREDNIDVLLMNIGNKLRMMSLKQQVIAEYKIHEILFLGMTNQLKLNNDDNEHQRTFTLADVNSEAIETSTVQ